MAKITIAAAAAPPEPGSDRYTTKMYLYVDESEQGRVFDANEALLGIRGALARGLEGVEEGAPPPEYTRLWDVYVRVSGISRRSHGHYSVDYYRHTACPAGCVQDMMGLYASLRRALGGTGKSKSNRKGKGKR